MSCQNLQSKIMNLWDTSLPIMFYITFKVYNTSSYAKAIKFTFLSCSSTTNQTNCPFWNISTVQDSIFTKPLYQSYLRSSIIFAGMEFKALESNLSYHMTIFPGVTCTVGEHHLPVSLQLSSHLQVLQYNNKSL